MRRRVRLSPWSSWAPHLGVANLTAPLMQELSSHLVGDEGGPMNDLGKETGGLKRVNMFVEAGKRN